jgi:hypothetical protein
MSPSGHQRPPSRVAIDVIGVRLDFVRVFSVCVESPLHDHKFLESM